MLCTRSVNPSQIGPCALSALARAQSSISAPRMTSMPPALRKDVGAHQHAAAGGRGDCALRPVHPGERIEHLEEEDEGRNVGVLGEALAAQLDHQRRQHQAAWLSACATSRLHGIGRVHDIGVGEQQIIRRLLRGHRGIDALLQRPQLAGPSRRQAAGCARRATVAVGIRGVARAISAVPSLLSSSTRMTATSTGIILPQQRADAVTDAVGLVARRHDRRDARP